jgi:glutathione peroxidase
MNVFPSDLKLTALDGSPLAVQPLLDQALLIVNVASRCGLTPQYEGLERLQERYRDQGFTVLGAPCNQFAGQEPGSAGEIAEFCSTTYGTTFPMTEKIEVNGARRHPLYRSLCEIPDADGVAGEVEWNFEKFVIAPGGQPVARFRPGVQPESEEILAAIEGAIAAVSPSTWEKTTAGQVRVGDRVRTQPEIELTVTRIDPAFFGNPQMLALIEDSPARWLKAPVKADAEVEVLRAGGAA